MSLWSKLLSEKDEKITTKGSLMKKVIKKDDKDNGEAISSQLRMKKGLREDVFNIKELILNVYVLGGIC